MKWKLQFYKTSTWYIVRYTLDLLGRLSTLTAARDGESENVLQINWSVIRFNEFTLILALWGGRRNYI